MSKKYEEQVVYVLARSSVALEQKKLMHSLNWDHLLTLLLTIFMKQQMSLSRNLVADLYLQTSICGQTKCGKILDIMKQLIFVRGKTVQTILDNASASLYI